MGLHIKSAVVYLPQRGCSQSYHVNRSLETGDMFVWIHGVVFYRKKEFQFNMSLRKMTQRSRRLNQIFKHGISSRPHIHFAKDEAHRAKSFEL